MAFLGTPDGQVSQGTRGLELVDTLDGQVSVAILGGLVFLGIQDLEFLGTLAQVFQGTQDGRGLLVTRVLESVGTQDLVFQATQDGQELVDILGGRGLLVIRVLVSAGTRDLE